MKSTDEKHLFLDMQEHPERYSDDQLEQMMAELDKAPDTEAVWQRMNSGRAVAEQPSRKTTLFALLPSLKRAVAFFAAVACLGVLSFAGYRAFSGQHRGVKTEIHADTSRHDVQRYVYEVHGNDTVFRFENVRLDSILTVVARHYDSHVVYRDKSQRALRLYTTCHTAQSLRDFVEMLNVFDGINIVLDYDMIYVEPDKTTEGKK